MAYRVVREISDSAPDWLVLSTMVDILCYDGERSWDVLDAICTDWGPLWNPEFSPIFEKLDGEMKNA